MRGAIARALRLTLDERDHLFLLAGHPVPEPQIALVGYADPGLITVLDALAPHVPALITDGLSTVVGQNPLNVALLGPLSGRQGLEANFTWHWFLDPVYRTMYGPNDLEALGRFYVADLRTAVVHLDQDLLAGELVDALLSGSAEFRRMWDLQEVSSKQSTRKLLQHPFVGLLDCECDVVLSLASQQRLVLFRSSPGSDTNEKLDMLRVLGTQQFTP